MNNITTKASKPKQGSELSVGQYVKYEPSGGSATESSAQTDNGYGKQDFTRKTLNWRILSVDGDNVKIISDIFAPDSGSASAGNMTFKGAEGYNNAVWELNRICSSLYAHPGATVRSVNLDDFNSTNSSISQTTGSAQTLYSDYRTVPGLYPSEEAKKSGGLKQSEQTQKYTGGATTSVSTAENTYWWGSIQSNSPLYNSSNYWLSSRCVDIETYELPYYTRIWAGFNLQYAYTSIGRYTLRDSQTSADHNNSRGVRAVVSLPSSCTFGNEKGDESNPITINWVEEETGYICGRCASGDVNHEAESSSGTCVVDDAITCSKCGHNYVTYCSDTKEDVGKCYDHFDPVPVSCTVCADSWE